jgi:hypothetical protein
LLDASGWNNADGDSGVTNDLAHLIFLFLGSSLIGDLELLSNVTPGCLDGLGEKSIRHSSLDSVGRYMSPAKYERSSAVSRKKMKGQYPVRLRCKTIVIHTQGIESNSTLDDYAIGERCEQSTSDKLIQTSPTATPSLTLILLSTSLRDSQFISQSIEIVSPSTRFKSDCWYQ